MLANIYIDDILFKIKQRSRIKTGGVKIDQERQKLITAAADPATDQAAIKAALAALEGKEPDKGSSQKYLSETEALTYAGGISRGTLWSWRKKGMESKKVFGRRLFKASDIDEFVEKFSCVS